MDISLRVIFTRIKIYKSWVIFFSLNPLKKKETNDEDDDVLHSWHLVTYFADALKIDKICVSSEHRALSHLP